MDPAHARNIAHRLHRYPGDRFDELNVEHLARVAAVVPPEARATAWLHDVREASGTDPAELRAEGLSDVELAALGLLSRAPEEVYELYALRIAHAPGEEGRIARVVKLADLEDHLAHDRITDSAPPYAWARRHIISAQFRRQEREPDAWSGAA
jgi:hypothetical protein